MRSIQEKLTFWRLISLTGVFVVCTALFWSFLNVERVNLLIHEITLKIRANNIYWSGNSLKGLSDETTGAIKAFVMQTPDVAAIEIVNVDFRNNERETIFFTSNNKNLIKEFNQIENSKAKNYPLFSDSTTLNDKIIRIINTNFLCEDVTGDDSSDVFTLVEVLPKITHICSISIPPFLGHFVGYMSIHLYEKPSKTEKEALRLMSVTLASSIYERDVIKY